MAIVELPERLNSAWQTAAAGTLGTFRGGSGFPLRFQGKKDGAFPFYKVSDMNLPGNKQVLSRANNYVDEAERRQMGAFVFPKDTIVFAKVGAAVFLERKKRLAQPSCIDNNMAGWILTKAELSPSYLQYFLLALRLGDFAGTTALPSLSGSMLREIPIRLPPTVAEQRTIAQALTDADALIESLEQLIGKKRRIQEGAMQELLTGKRRLPGFEGEWQEYALGDLLESCTSGATPYRANPRFWDGSVRWITSGELRGTRIFDTADRITEEAVTQTNLQVHPPGTVLIAITGLEAAGTRGSCGIVGSPSTTNQSCMALYPLPILDSMFLFLWYWQNGDVLAFEYAQGTKQQSFTAEIVKRFLVFLPPTVEEQRAICESLGAMEAEISALLLRLEKARQIKEGMMQELLTGRIRLV